MLTRGLAHVKSVDTVVALKCREWPKIAEEWIERRREFDWPGGALIEEAVEKGCYLVPIGGHQSQCEEMEWRISFVLAERLLIRNMNFIQRFVYSILKTIRKEIFGHFLLSFLHILLKQRFFGCQKKTMFQVGNLDLCLDM